MPDAEYNRGHFDGDVSARLGALEDHKKIMNGHLAAIELAVSDIKTEQRRLADQMSSDAIVREQVRLTLEKRTLEEEKTNSKKWAPRMRFVALMAVLPVMFSMLYFATSLVVRDIVGKM